MKKSFALQVDRASWPVSPAGVPQWPFSIHQQRVTIDFLGALAWMGKMSVPLGLPRWWHASQWARIRYFAAATQSRSLRLHPAIKDLDTHQRKVLSDDWGVGFALQWLSSRFSYGNVVDGYAAMRDLERKKIATFLPKKNKSGPDKCPDFIAYDAQGKIHILECKGSQSGPKYSAKQVVRGRQQKRNVQFTNPSIVDQRLVTAFSFAEVKAHWESTLLVVDPPPDETSIYYRVTLESANPIIATVRRLTVLRGLLLAGANDVASHAFPIETGASREEAPQPVHEPFVAGNRDWVGQTYELRFPIPIRFADDLLVRGCRARYGVAPKIRDLFMKYPPKRELQEQLLSEFDLELAIEAEGDEGEAEAHQIAPVTDESPTGVYASVRSGEAFIAEWELIA